MWHHHISILWLHFLQERLRSNLTLPVWSIKPCSYFCPPHLTQINRCTASCGDWLIDCWGPAVLALSTAPSAPSAQLFCPLVSIQTHVNRCSTVHRWLLSGCLTKNHSIWFGRELDPNSPLLHADTWAQWLSCHLLWRWHHRNSAFSLQVSSKTGPPAIQLMRVKQPGSHSAVKREKRLSTSSFPFSANRELQKLLALAGTPPSLGNPLFEAAHPSDNSLSSPARYPLSGAECSIKDRPCCL